MKQFPVSCVTKYMYLFIKKYSYALKVQIMIEKYICTSRFDNFRQGMHLLLENDKNQGNAVSFHTFLLNFRCIITMLLSL